MWTVSGQIDRHKERRNQAERIYFWYLYTKTCPSGIATFFKLIFCVSALLGGNCSKLNTTAQEAEGKGAGKRENYSRFLSGKVHSHYLYPSSTPTNCIWTNPLLLCRDILRDATLGKLSVARSCRFLVQKWFFSAHSLTPFSHTMDWFFTDCEKGFIFLLVSLREKGWRKEGDKKYSVHS